MNVPYDVLALIFEHVPPSSLRAVANVSSTFHDAAIPVLYRSINIREPSQLLATLTRRPERALHIKRIGTQPEMIIRSC